MQQRSQADKDSRNELFDTKADPVAGGLQHVEITGVKWRAVFFCLYATLSLLLSLGKQREQRGMRAQKVILRGPFERPATPVVHSSAPSRCSCGSHRSARRPLGSENTPRSSGAASPCGCLARLGCCQMARENRP